MKFLTDNDVINPAQYGFRPGHSTQHALINATENIYRSLDDSQCTLGIFIDFSKAFDTVSHDILLAKLEHYGIKGNMLQLLRSYLSDRKQYVSYGNVDIPLLPITAGVPQGSVLGPLLFLMFINDLPNISDTTKFVLFADDSNLFLSHSNRYTLYSLANEALQKLYEYCCANRIVINLDKCCFMEFKSSQSDQHNYSLGILNSAFKKVDDCKFLGVYISSSLKWKLQIKHVKSQVSKATGALNSVKKIVPPKLLRNIYFALVQPYLVYCAPIWGSTHNTNDYEDLFKAQKKAVRVISNMTYKVNYCFVNTKPLFHKNNILTVHNMYFYLLSTEAYKILNNRSPRNIYSYFEVSPRSIRLLTPKFKLTSLQANSFSFTASKIINFLLRSDICYSGYTIKSFKGKLKSHLMFRQSLCIKKDPNWLPLNYNIYSDVKIENLQPTR